jgi:membrane protein required for colicin V production
MNWLDIVLIIALILPIFTGLKQGLIKAALSLAGLIVGVVLASNFYEPLSEVLGFIPNEDIANVVAFILIISVVMLIASLLSSLLKLTARAVMLGWVDHLSGAIFGFLLGAILWGALLAIWVKFFGTALVTESVLAKVLLDRFPLILALLPGEFDIVRDFFQ